MTRQSRQTPEQAQWQADYDAQRARQHRRLVDAFQVWSFCPRKGCRRLRSCRNKRPTLCLNAFLEAMPEEIKQYARLVLTARAGGASPAEADRIARERMIAVDGRTPYDDL